MIYSIYNSSIVIRVRYNRNTYYIKNIQKYVVEIINSDLEQLVNYEYDSYGKILSIKDENNNEITNLNHIGHINPFRYRSYYYDLETKLYYLNSRYYNPEWGRYINADSELNGNEDIIGYNLYAYVSNNPVNYFDEKGQWKILSLVKIVQKAVTVVKNAVTSLVKSVAKTILNDFKKSTTIEFGNGSGLGGSADIGGISASVKNVTSKYTTTIIPFKSPIIEESLSSEMNFSIMDFGFTSTNFNTPSSKWEMNFGPMDLTENSIFVGIQGDLYLGIGVHGKVGFEFDNSTLTYNLIKVIFPK